jgi:prephenate dehydrogenase
MKKRFGKITIIGVGLIGGSVGLAVKKRGMAREVAGVFRRPSTMKRALACGAVDSGCMDVASGVRDADIIIIASPVSSITRIAREAAAYAKRGAVVTDAGSTKAAIVAAADRMFSKSGAAFVGSHPMAGSERTGVEASRADLFEGSPCIVTRTGRTGRAALGTVAAFWRSLGARVSVMSPGEHDRAVSLISHLPHIVAFSLAGSVPARALEYAAEGFADTTRVASSDPALWSDIFLTNRANIRRSAAIFRKRYDAVVSAIAGGDRRGTMKALKEAVRKRAIFLRRADGKKG